MRRNSISEAWAARPIEMLESPAYRVLSLSAHRVLSRIEIEFAHHAGRDNGKLPVTFDDFAHYGVRRHSIGPALRELEALGFIVITERGTMAKAAEYRRANRFLLTARPKQKGDAVEGRWRQYKTIRDAKAAVAVAMKSGKETGDLPSERKSRQCRNGIVIGAETALEGQNRQCRNGTTMRGRNGTTIYISGRDADYQAKGSGTVEPPAAAGRTDTELSMAEVPPFPPIDGVYRIAGRAELVVVFAVPGHALPLAKPNHGAALAVAAE